ncbi:MAG: hypothetical protein ACREA2_24405 [Blastocatellia bacterium]
MTKRRNVIVHIGTSADGYIARSDGDLVPLDLHSVERFEDGLVQLRYRV